MIHRPRRSRLRAAARRDDGAGSVELAVLAVVALMLAFTAIQAGLYFHARKVAQSAARHGVETGRQLGASPSDGITQAEDFLARYGNSVRDAHVTASGSTSDRIRLTVTGRVATLVPGLELDLTQHAAGPIERWTNP